MKKLIINGTIADLPTEGKIALTKQSNDLFDMQNKRAGLSNRILLPKTEINNEIFYFANDLTAFNLSQRNFYTVKYFQDYEEIISDGRGLLVGCNGGYEFIFYSGNISLVDVLGSQTLRDLDLSNLRKLWNLTNVAALTITGAQSKDINYPICNTHDTEELRSGLTTGTALYPGRMLPFISCRRLLSQIFTDNGLVAEGDIGADILDITDIQQDLFIPVIDRQTDVTRRLNVIASVRELMGTYDSYQYLISGVNTEKVFEIANFTDGTTDFDNYFEATEIATYQLKCNLNMGIKYLSVTDQVLAAIITKLTCAVVIFAETDSGTGIFPNHSLADVLLNNLSLGYVNISQEIIDNTSNSNTATFWLTLNQILSVGELTITKQLAVGERVRFRVYLQTTLLTAYAYPDPTAHYDTKINLETGTIINIEPTIVQYGEYYPIAENLPEIQQIDFVKFIAAYFGYLIDIEDGTNIVRFERISDVLSDTINAQDWSDNLQDFEIVSLHTELGQTNFMDYANEEVLQQDGEGSFEIADDTLQQTNQFYTAPFSASANETWDNQSTIIGRYPIIKVWNEAFNKIKPRIFKLRLENFTHCQIGISPYIDAQQKYVAYFAASQGWNAVLSGRYLEYQAMMADYKQIEARCYFTASEFKAIDTLKPVWIRQLGSFFFIQSVNNYVKDQITSVTLIKI